jgi:hypothetical protein
VGREPSVYGGTAGFPVGLGLGTNVVDGIHVFAEARYTIDLTDYAADDFAFTTNRALLLGVRLR